MVLTLPITYSKGAPFYNAITSVCWVVGYFDLDLKILQARKTPATATPIESTSVTCESCMRTGICITLLFPPSACHSIIPGYDEILGLGCNWNCALVCMLRNAVLGL